MEVKAKQIDSVNASANLKISAKSIKDEVENLAKQASKTLKMDGFRPGKVPVNAILKRYEKDLVNDAEQKLFQKVVNLALKELKKDNKDLVAEPYFENLERKEGDIHAELILSFKPKVDVSGYEALIPKFNGPKVSKKEIDEKKDQTLKGFSTPKAIDEKRPLKEGDFAKFDFEGFINDKAFEGGKAENFVLQIGSKQFIPGFEDNMIGMKTGEEKNINVTFPKEYGVQSLAGKEAVFKIKLHEIQELIPAKLDEELLKKLFPDEKDPSEELLDKKLEEQIKTEKLYKLINEELKTKFADALVEKFNFDLPKGIVEQETDVQFRDAWKNFSEEEINTFKENKEKAKEKRDSFRDEAAKSVKLTFIVDALARARNISISDQEVIQTVYFEAYRYGADPKQLLENYKKKGVLPAIKMSLMEEKLFNDIFMNNDKTKMEDK